MKRFISYYDGQPSLHFTHRDHDPLNNYVCPDSESRLAVSLWKQMDDEFSESLLFVRRSVLVLFCNDNGDRHEEQISIDGLIRNYPENEDPAFFSQGFIMRNLPKQNQQHPKLFRMFDFDVFHMFLRQLQEEDQNPFETPEYKYIKNACKTRDEIIMSEEVHPIFKAVPYVPEMQPNLWK